MLVTNLNAAQNRIRILRRPGSKGLAAEKPSAKGGSEPATDSKSFVVDLQPGEKNKLYPGDSLVMDGYRKLRNFRFAYVLHPPALGATAAAAAVGGTAAPRRTASLTTGKAMADAGRVASLTIARRPSSPMNARGSTTPSPTRAPGVSGLHSKSPNRRGIAESRGTSSPAHSGTLPPRIPVVSSNDGNTSMAGVASSGEASQAPPLFGAGIGGAFGEQGSSAGGYVGMDGASRAGLFAAAEVCSSPQDDGTVKKKPRASTNSLTSSCISSPPQPPSPVAASSVMTAGGGRLMSHPSSSKRGTPEGAALVETPSKKPCLGNEGCLGSATASASVACEVPLTPNNPPSVPHPDNVSPESTRDVFFGHTSNVVVMGGTEEEEEPAGVDDISSAGYGHTTIAPSESGRAPDVVDPGSSVNLTGDMAGVVTTMGDAAAEDLVVCTQQKESDAMQARRAAVSAGTSKKVETSTTSLATPVLGASQPTLAAARRDNVVSHTSDSSEPPLPAAPTTCGRSSTAPELTTGVAGAGQSEQEGKTSMPTESTPMPTAQATASGRAPQWEKGDQVVLKSQTGVGVKYRLGGTAHILSVCEDGQYMVKLAMGE